MNSPAITAQMTHRKGQWSNAVDTVTLCYDSRILRRKALNSDSNLTFLADLPQTVSLNQGDAFELTDGRVIEVVSAIETLVEIKSGNLIEIVWHIGNRHTPCQIEKTRLLIQPDHVICEMVKLLGATIRKVSEPFSPLGGAYGHGRTHSHAR